MSAASPLSLPIARLRALGARVGYTISHNPSKHALKPWIGLAVTMPDGRRYVFSQPGHAYRTVVRGLEDLAWITEAGKSPTHTVVAANGSVLRVAADAQVARGLADAELFGQYSTTVNEI